MCNGFEVSWQLNLLIYTLKCNGLALRQNRKCNAFKNKKCRNLQHKFQYYGRIVCQRIVGCCNLNLLWHMFENVDVSQQFFGQQLLIFIEALSLQAVKAVLGHLNCRLVFHALSEWLC